MNPSPAILITGAAQRIGRHFALGLAADGWAVALHYNRSGEAAEALVKQITEDGGKAVALQADLMVEAQVQGLIPAATATLGPLSALVNNASLFERDEIADSTRENWDRHIETNLRAPLVLAQAFARQLPEDMQGCIINMLDQRVWHLTPHFLTYTLSKAGLWTLTQTLAMALAPRIRVNGIGPGLSLPSIHQTPEQFAARRASMPLERGTTPEELLEAMRFLLKAPAVTGQMIVLDGGEHLGWAQSSKGFTLEEG